MAKRSTAKRTAPPKNRRPGCLVAMALLVAILVVGGALAYLQLTQPLLPGSRTRLLVTVPKGASARTVGAILSRRHVIRTRQAFQFAAKFSGEHKSLKPGVYELSPGMTPAEILSVIENGRVSMDSVTFPEGWTLEQFADLLSRRGMVDRDEFLGVAHNDGRSFTAPHGFVPPSSNLEGFLFPDTYRFGKQSSARLVIAEMLANFEHRVVQDRPGVKDWEHVVTVASLVEREARVPEDRPLIAGVIENRLRIGMRLQIDATVQYALPKHKARLMYSDLKVQSPYNTYRHAGLPPTPICSPGVACIDAAIKPTASDYLFYVSGPGDKHIFTRSMAEHDAVRAKLRATGQGR
ncbi:MAG TPA: endolytic transglycosylase MltG [Capsulimonadaceae bacterium]|jgi:UPF0755 protein